MSEETKEFRILCPTRNLGRTRSMIDEVIRTVSIAIGQGNKKIIFVVRDCEKLDALEEEIQRLRTYLEKLRTHHLIPLEVKLEIDGVLEEVGK